MQGTLKAKPITPTSSRLFSPNALTKKDIVVWLGADRANGKLVTIVSSKKQEPKGLYLVHVRGVDDRTTAESMIGLSLYGKSEERADLSDDEYFVDDLVGLRIVDRKGTELGQLVTVHAGVANDVYETDTGMLIPAVKSFIDRVDIHAGLVTVVDADALKIE